MRRFRPLQLLPVAALALVLAPGAGATTVDPAVLPAGTAGTAYSQTLTSSTGTAPFTFAVTAGSLPPGLSLASGGLLSGTPTSSGSYSFTVTATDFANVTAARAYTLSISPAAVAISPATLPPGSRSVFYSQALSGSGGTAPYTFAVTAGSLPAGLALGASGTLSGTPGAVGSYTFTVTSTDANASSGSRTYTLNINVATLDIVPGALGDAAAGLSYSVVFSATGGTAPYSYALNAGSSLPPGMSLASNGSFTGTPSAAGQYTFTVKVTDGTAQTATRTYAFKVTLNAVLVQAALADGTYGEAYNASFAASGGSAPYTFTLVAGSLPAGMTLTTAGTLSGTPTAYGTYSFSVNAFDKYGASGSYPFTLVIAPPTIAMVPNELFAATSGLFYSAKMAASGGLGAYTYTVTAGALPSGLALASDGTISGIPNAVPGLYTFTVTATDAYGATGTKVMTLKLATPYILVSTVGLPGATVGVTYLQTLTVTGGSAPYTYSLVDGTLPSGLSLSPAGVITGAPTSAGTSTFTVLIVDANGVKGTQSFRLVVETATPTVVKKPPKKPVAKTPVKKKKKAKQQAH
jgi:hypothetical protein